MNKKSTKDNFKNWAPPTLIFFYKIVSYQKPFVFRLKLLNVLHVLQSLAFSQGSSNFVRKPPPAAMVCEGRKLLFLIYIGFNFDLLITVIRLLARASIMVDFAGY